MKQPVFKGVCTALVTPFTEDFIDFPKLYELIDIQIEAGIAALVICGTTGEASTQTIPEHLAVIERAVVHARGRVPIIAGTGSNDTAHALMMSQNAAKSGADALLMVTPYYNKCSQIGLVKHFEYVADRVNVPVILYNVPSRTGMTIAYETYERLAKHPNVNGVKEASSNLELSARLAEIPCFNVWSGNDDEFLKFLDFGGEGVISVASNIIPRELCEVYKLHRANRGAAHAQFEKYLDLCKKLFIDVNPIPVKTAMNMLGMNAGHLRMPLCESEPEKNEILRAALKDAGLL